MEFKIRTDDKPNLERMLKENPKLAKEVIGTFVEMMEEACDPEKGLMWAELPQLFSESLTFNMLIKGILRGSLDLKDINPDDFDVIKEEVHPLSMLMPRKDYLNGGMRRYNWRNHFRLPQDAEINEETIATIFRTLLRYYKYINVKTLANALINNQIATFQGLGERNVELLPFVPALRYQQAKFGDLHVGKFLENIGFLDCGDWLYGDENECPCCQHPEVMSIGNKYKGCLSCNAGFEIKDF